MEEIDFKSECPIHKSLFVIGDKWSLLILRDMLFFEYKYYGEFLSSKEKISTNILANRLLKLEELGLITKYPDPSNKTRFIYSLTEKSIDLIPLIVEALIWGIKYYPIDDQSCSELIKKIRINKEVFIEDLKDQCKTKIR